MKKEKNLISIRIVSNEQLFNLVISVNSHMSCANLMTYMSQEIKKIYRKLDFTSKTIDSLDIKDGDTFFAFEIKPLLDENLELEVSVLVDY